MQLPENNKEAVIAFAESVQGRIKWTIEDIDKQISQLRAKQDMCRELQSTIEFVLSRVDKDYI